MVTVTWPWIAAISIAFQLSALRGLHGGIAVDAVLGLNGTGILNAAAPKRITVRDYYARLAQASLASSSRSLVMAPWHPHAGSTRVPRMPYPEWAWRRDSVTRHYGLIMASWPLGPLCPLGLLYISGVVLSRARGAHWLAP